MTTPISQQQDDNDSLYDQPIVKSPTKVPRETVLPDEEALKVDNFLDSEETPPPSTSTSVISNSSAIQILSEHSHSSASSHGLSDDERFDSDENQISTSSSSSSSSASSTTTIPERPSQEKPPIIPSTETQRPIKPAATFLSRASATFYKAFRKKKPTPPPTVPPTSQQDHTRLAQLFDAQIATLRSARTGFVDLALVKPMTQRTLDAIQDASHVLRDFVNMETKVATLRKQVELGEREAEKEIRGKERILVEAKVRLAEVSEEVERLRHELRGVQKALADPKRADRRKVAEARREALVCREARRDMEKRLSQKQSELDLERGKLQSVEKDYRDIEGDWA